MTNPAYYECQCGFYHLLGSTGACGNDTLSFIIEELDEKHPEGWDETETQETDTPVKRHKNYDRMMGLTADSDINSKKIEPGCRVRVFDSAAYDNENDWFSGMELIGPGPNFKGFVEGELLRIEEYAPKNENDPRSAGTYYVILPLLNVFEEFTKLNRYNPLEQPALTGRILTETLQNNNYGRGWTIMIPVNGTIRHDGTKFFGVLRV
jgi:hypothetical protein